MERINEELARFPRSSNGAAIVERTVRTFAWGNAIAFPIEDAEVVGTDGETVYLRPATRPQ